MAATRTWVSGVGDDANPCSRTAPCKTFAGAISKTNAGGEISVLDPGGFGAVTITKGVTIDGDASLASVLVAGTNGIIINAPGAVVILRRLSLIGIGSGLNGVRVLAAAAVHVEYCTIASFTTHGIDINVGANTKVFVKDSIIRSCTGNGINATATAGFIVQVTVEDTQIEQCANAIRAASGSRVSIHNCVLAGGSVGLLADQTVGPDNPVATIEKSRISENTSAGIRSGPGTPEVRVADCLIINNLTGLDNVGGGTIVSFQNNHLIGNGANGAPTGTANPI